MLFFVFCTKKAVRVAMADCHSRDPSYDFEADMKSLELLNVGEMVKLLWPGFVFPLWGWRDSISGNMRKELSLLPSPPLPIPLFWLLTGGV